MQRSADGSKGAGSVQVIVVMGVSGAGKTLVGQTLGATLGWRFYDGDDYHSAANIEKMSRGEALTDADRAPWLAALHELIVGIVERADHGVVACSALKHDYREKLAPGGLRDRAVRFVFLDVPREVLEERLAHREGHFASPALLDSQLATLERPRDACRVDGTLTPEEIVRQIRTELGV